MFAGFAASRLRTAIARACRAAAVQLFSPHTHLLADERGLDYAGLLAE